MRNEKKYLTPISPMKQTTCGVPIRIDSYSGCTFGCKYCFSNTRNDGRAGGPTRSDDYVRAANPKQIDNLLNKVLVDNKINPKQAIDALVAKGYDMHMGGMSDPLQPIEGNLHITKEVIDVTNKYGIHILISTKGCQDYGIDFRPELHSFQLSISNDQDRTDIEPNVSSFERRYEFYKSLKERGFKVGIRIQPFIPGITTTSIIDKFKDADHFVIEGIKIPTKRAGTPENEHLKWAKDNLGLDKDQFCFKGGFYYIKPEIRLEAYKPFVEKLEEYGLSFSVSDNDLRWLGNNKCCCGDALLHNVPHVDTTALIKKYGVDFNKQNVLDEYEQNDAVRELHFSGSRKTGDTLQSIERVLDEKFDSKASAFSPKFQCCTDCELCSQYMLDSSGGENIDRE